MVKMVEGWKGIVNYFESRGIQKHPRTIKEWHYRILKIPFDRISHQSFVIPEQLLEHWYVQVLLRKKQTPYHRHI